MSFETLRSFENNAGRGLKLEGSAGTYRLKEELTRRVNTAIAPGRITAVLFKEMLVQ